MLIASDVFDLFPLGVERRGGELRVVVEVMAGDAQRFLSLGQRDTDFFVGSVFVTGIDQLDVPAAGAVTVLAAVVKQMRRLRLALETARVAQHFLSVPTGDVA